MIDIFDVRANNWIAIAGQPVLVREITYSPLVTDNCRVNNFLASEVEGILVTLGILEQAGFKKDPDGVYMYGNCLYYLEGRNPQLQIASGYSPIMNLKCQYVHELQNLMRDFYKREITIKF